MDQGAAVIERFYGCFGQRDAEGMAACYTDDVVFSDPAFGELHGERARGNMARVPQRQGPGGGRLRGHGRQATGRAHWEADYTFGVTGRKVHNVVEARFDLAGGLIARHTDSFDFATWAGQAFGPVGSVLGHTPLLPFALRRMANRQLDQFQRRRA